MGRLATVVISNSTRQFDKEYHYLVPEKIAEKVKVGVRVVVPFGKSDTLREAYVVGMPESSEIKDLKYINKVLDDEPVLDSCLIELAKWMKKRYICTYSDALKCMLPAGLRIKKRVIVRLAGEHCDGLTEDEEKILDIIKNAGEECSLDDIQKSIADPRVSKKLEGMKKKGILLVNEEYQTRAREKQVRVVTLARPAEEIAELLESNVLRSINHIRVLEILMENEAVPVGELTAFAGVSTSVLRTMAQKGYVDFFEMEVMREPWLDSEIERSAPLKLTKEQQTVFNGLIEYIEGKEFREALIHGVTGSGKTEVYMQLISEVLNRGRQAVVLVPEISLTPQMVRRFRARFGDDVAVQHSRLSLGERYDQWRLIKDGGVKVVVGARSAVFAPVRDPGIIIIDEEHESSYKSGVTPRYDAREVARMRCRQMNAILVLGSATPSVESVYRCRNGSSGYFQMVSRPNNITLPTVEIVDMRNELAAGNKSMFSRRLEEEIRRNIADKQQTMLLINRRGHSYFVMCRSCGYSVKCPDCSITLTYHSKNDRLICHYCGYTVRNPSVCPSCGSKYIKFFGAGTQKVESEIKKMFPEASVLRMDMDTTTGKNAHESILRRFEEENINILVGTQMIAKGHDFPNVTLVGVMAADAMLNIGDYLASERTFQLLTQVAGRAGRGKIPGRVVIQAYNTDDYSITSACQHDYEGFFAQEKAVRERLGYPPFCHIGMIVASGKNDKLVYERVCSIYDMLLRRLQICSGKAYVTKPKRSPLSRIRGKYRWRVVVKSKSLEWLINEFTRVSDSYAAKKREAVELSMDINPVNMV